jgi:hypothetical protein
MWPICSPLFPFVSLRATTAYIPYGYGKVVSHQTKREANNKKNGSEMKCNGQYTGIALKL